jgi:hypothetical protein
MGDESREAKGDWVTELWAEDDTLEAWVSAGVAVAVDEVEVEGASRVEAARSFCMMVDEESAPDAFLSVNDGSLADMARGTASTAADTSSRRRKERRESDA